MATYTSQYPPAHSDTYVKATTRFDTNHWAYFATDPTKSLTGTQNSNSWVSAWAGLAGNQRFHIDLGSAKVIKRIYYENAHHGGTITEEGVQNFTFWGSNTSGSFINLNFTTDTGWTQLTTSQPTFDRHVDLDQADPKYITVTNLIAYRYYALKFPDNYGDIHLMGIRRIELQIVYGSLKTEVKSEATASDSDIDTVGGKRTLTIENHLIQNQTVADIISAAYLADYKDQKTKLVITKPCPAPYEIGDTVERGAGIPYAPAVTAEISYAPAATAVHPYGLAPHDMLIRKISISFSAGNYVSILELES